MAWYKETLGSSTLLVMERPKTRPMRPELLIDFRSLSEQKIALIQLMNSPSVDEAQETALEGLITMIETIQEHAIDEGVEDTEVHPYLEPV
jgi:hypothetical protein